jgi:6,7-dimethyl-8-ribityllumazine synthase
MEYKKNPKVHKKILIAVSTYYEEESTDMFLRTFNCFGCKNPIKIESFNNNIIKDRYQSERLGGVFIEDISKAKRNNHNLFLNLEGFGEYEKFIPKGMEDWGFEVNIVKVSGCMELPQVIKAVNKRQRQENEDKKEYYKSSKSNYDGCVAIGLVVKGDTTHFDHVSNQTMNGLSKIALKNNLPLGNAVLTLNNMDQLDSRRDKGIEALIACLQVMKIKHDI